MDKLFLVALFLFILFQVVRKYFRKTLPSTSSESIVDDDCFDDDELACYSGACNIKNGNFNNSILESVGYFTASNDEKQTNSYCPTSLQDINPNELA